MDERDLAYNEELVPCPRCHGEGWLLVCPDDMCHGLGECMHGDGEVVCPDCKGNGELLAKVYEQAGEA